MLRSPAVHILVSIYLPSVLMGFAHGMTLPTLPQLALSFDVAPELASQVVTAQLAGRTVALFPAGWIVDHLGRRTALIVGPMVAIAGALGSVSVPWFGALLACQVAIGVGDSLWSFGREIAAVDQIRPEVRGRVIGAFFGISSAGAALGPVLGGLLTGWYGYQSVFLTYAAQVAVVWGLAFLVRESRPRRSRGVGTAETSVRVSPWSYVPAEYQGTFKVLLAATFCAMLRSTSVASLLPIYAVTYLGYSTADVGYLFGITGFIQLLMIAPAGYVSDTIGRKAATVPAAALAAVAFVGFYLARDLVSLAIVSGILGLSAGFAIGTMTSFTYDIIAEEGRGVLQALRRSVGEIGSFTGPIVGGLVASAYDPGVAFLAFAPLHLVSAALLLFVARESLARRVRPSPA